MFVLCSQGPFLLESRIYNISKKITVLLNAQDPEYIKGKRKVQGVQQSQAAALPRHEEEEETDKTKQAQIKQTCEKH